MRISDWSSDVCSSDLSALGGEIRIAAEKIEHRVAARRCGRENEARKELRIRRLPGLIQGRNLERFAPARFEINAVRWRIDDTNLGRRHLVDTSMIFEPKGSDELKFVDEWQRIARGYKRQRELAVAKGDLSRLREYVDRRFDPTDDTPGID